MLTNNAILKGIAFFFSLFVFLPYIAIVPTGTDTQPNALLAASLLLLLFLAITRFRMTFTWPIACIILIFAYSVIISLSLNSIGIRSIMGYASVSIIALASYHVFNRGLFTHLTIRIAAFTWFFFGAVQMFFNPEFGSQLMTRASGSSFAGRGVVSLAPEPSYYGIVCVFMLLVIQMLMSVNSMDKKQGRRYQLFLSLQILLLAQSFTAVTLVLVYYVSNLMVRLSVKNVFRISLSVTIAGAIVMHFFATSRMGRLLGIILTHPFEIMRRDQSASERLVDIFASFYGFYESLPFSFGHGTSSYLDFMATHSDIFPTFDLALTSNKIMSGYGSALFELGYMGILLILAVLYAFWQTKNREYQAVGLFLTAVMFSAIPPSFPLFGFMIGMAEWNRLSKRA